MIKVNKENPVICWFSGGITSAVACHLAIQHYGKENCRSIFIDTNNEDEDTYRFLDDCEELFGIPIEKTTNEKYNNIQEVWTKFKGMNFAHGAICSSELKRAVRIKFQKENNYSYQVFGFDIDEPRRAKSMTLNNSDANPIYPLLLHGMSKKQCLDMFESFNIEPPRAYKWGFHNNNCLKTGCVQGGIGYWQKIHREKPELYEAMGNMEHHLTDLKGSPVTLCKTQTKEAISTGNTILFLKKSAKYPEVKTVLEVKGREPKPLLECNGFCGINDLSPRSETEQEINVQTELDL